MSSFATHIFSAKNFSIFDVNFNETLTNDIVSFEQLGPDCSSFWVLLFALPQPLVNKFIKKCNFEIDTKTKPEQC